MTGAFLTVKGWEAVVIEFDVFEIHNDQELLGIVKLEFHFALNQSSKRVVTYLEP